jgi:hypothetical protein
LPVFEQAKFPGCTFYDGLATVSLWSTTDQTSPLTSASTGNAILHPVDAALEEDYDIHLVGLVSDKLGG